MLPVIAIVGRPNVGKSTLFNLLTRSRDALVADVPGLTRDRQYGYGKLGVRPYVVVDTGGLEGEADELKERMTRQTQKAITESDAVIFLVDGRAGLTAADHNVAAQLRRSGKPVYVAVNKTEGMAAELVTAEFHALGLGAPQAIASAHGTGVGELIDSTLAGLPLNSDADVPVGDDTRVSVAVIGRPNVGKSTLINRLLGEERLLAGDRPGTTRDSIYVPFERDGRTYTLIDTAGVRRRARVEDAIEKFSIIKTLQAIDRAQVVIALVDGQEGVTEQDASLLGLAVERGRALVIAVNKWDGLSIEQRETVRRTIDLKLPFLEFARLHFISALHGSGIGDLMSSVDEAAAAAMREIVTPELTRALQAAVVQHQPPLVRGRRIKLRYAHQGGRNPPVIVVHGNQTDEVPGDYRRYLENTFRKRFDLYGTPVRIEFRSGENPYARQRKKLTPKKARIARRQRRIRKKRGS
ncbi:MAG TPA: ribosome biogenesis GTPase Der [Gammaproteobacteria bacterium]|nr:ribosome biogenesis GTPase Der [Gammaproteobacteria bacterium]